MTADTPDVSVSVETPVEAPVANGDAAPTELGSDITEKVLTSFTTSLAVLVDARLKKYVSKAKMDAENARQAKKEEEKKKEEELEAEKKAEKTAVDAMVEEVCRIDSVCLPKTLFISFPIAAL